MSQQIPYVLSLIVCDHVWIEPATGKRNLLGTFTSLRASSFPLIIAELSISLSITDGRGMTPVTIVIVDALELRPPVMKLVAEIDFADPLMVAEGVFNVQRLTLPEPGEYRVQVFSGDEFLIERRITAYEVNHGDAS